MRSIGSLFAGIGGLELGLERSGLGQVWWQVEIDPFCRKVLAKHWPTVDRSVEDVHHAGRSTLAPVDVICGGFPCQDVSSAGKRAGLDGARSGLWREFKRVLGEQQPRGLVIENVASGKQAWLPTVIDDLAALGYRARALGIAARDVGAPHRRARIFVVGVAHPHSADRRIEPGRWGWASRPGETFALDLGTGPAQPIMDRGADGLPARLDAHRWPAHRGQPQHVGEAPRTVPPRTLRHRPQRCKALGNAVVPQCATIAGWALIEMLEGRA